MARIIKKNESESQVKEAGKVKDLKPKKTNKLSLKFKILVGFGFFVIFLVLSASIILAQTGIVKVPLLSSIFYKTPMPTRVLNVPLDYQPEPENLSISGSQEEGLLNFAFGEKELTFIFRKALTQGSNKFAENPQIVITPEYIEFFAYQLKPFKANITLKIKPYMKKETLNFDLVEYKIGNFKVPKLIISPFLAKFLKSDPKTSQAINQIIQIKAFNLYDGRLDFIAKVEMENFLKIITVISEASKK